MGGGGVLVVGRGVGDLIYLVECLPFYKAESHAYQTNECVNVKQLARHPVRDKMTQKGKQTLHFLCFMSDINVFRKLFRKRGIYIQLPIDIGVCGVNHRPPTSCIVTELFFAC